MVNIVFDILSAQPQGNTKFHGGGEYTKHILREFLGMYGELDSVKVSVCLNEDSFVDDWIKEKKNKGVITVYNVKSTEQIIELLNQLSISNKIRFFAGQIYDYSKYSLPKSVIGIGTCHGLRMLEKPRDVVMLFYTSGINNIKTFIKLFLLRNRYKNAAYNVYKKSIETFQYIVTDSRFSEYSIRNHFNTINIGNIYTFYPMTDMQEGCTLRGIDNIKHEDYIMIISADRWIKNAYRGIAAIDGLYSMSKLSSIQTRVYGKYPEKCKKTIKNISRFEFYDYVESEELKRAYSECVLFVYPTLNEGFGLPPLEAMQYGKTCVISSVCSLPEVYGDAVYFINPYDVTEIQIRILEAIDHKIPESKIAERVNQIEQRQKADTQKICNLIYGREILDK